MTRVLVGEGHDDRVFFEHLVRTFAGGASYDVFPKKGAAALSRDGAIRFAVAAVRTGEHDHIVIAVDLDDDDEPGVRRQVKRAFRAGGVALAGTGGAYRAGATGVVVLPVGLADHPGARSLGITRHAMDDYLVVLLDDRETYERLTTRRDDVTRVPHGIVREKMRRVVDLLREQDIAVERGKQCLDIWRAIVGFRASPAELADAILRSAPEAHVRALCGSLIARIPGLQAPGA